MDDLLELLIHTINTVDGSKNSADLIKKRIHSIKYHDEYKRQVGLSRMQHMKEIKFVDTDAIWNLT